MSDDEFVWHGDESDPAEDRYFRSNIASIDLTDLLEQINELGRERESIDTDRAGESPADSAEQLDGEDIPATGASTGESRPVDSPDIADQFELLLDQIERPDTVAPIDASDDHADQSIVPGFEHGDDLIEPVGREESVTEEQESDADGTTEAGSSPFIFPHSTENPLAASSGGDGPNGAADSPTSAELESFEPSTAFDTLLDAVLESEEGGAEFNRDVDDTVVEHGDGSTSFRDLITQIDSFSARRSSPGRPPSTGPERGKYAQTSGSGSPSAEASSVLLIESSEGVDDVDVCFPFIRESDPDRTNLLLVWLSRDVNDQLERLYDVYADRSTTVTVVCRTEVSRSFYADPSIPTGESRSNLTIERITDPRDLPKLGITISQIIADWRQDPNHTVLCFNSITNLLQFANQERVFRFLHVLQSRMDSIGATAHYHIEQEAVETRTIDTFRNLFDETVDATGHGDGHTH